MTMDIASRDDGRKPVIALLGEFSAGKSTLANVLLGTSRSPVRVTATQVPPIWFVAGGGAPVRVAADGREIDLPDGILSDVPLHSTRAVRIPVQAEFLERFSLIDMPGSSDPNMSPDTWDALLPLADIVIWCTPATQAWRQSEAAIWDMVPDVLYQRSLLLLTRMDKLGSDADRSRVLGRVERETAGLFRSVHPVSLLAATEAPSECETSGMADVMRALDICLSGKPPAKAAEAAPEPVPDSSERTPAAPVLPRRVAVKAPTWQRREERPNRPHGDPT